MRKPLIIMISMFLALTGCSQKNDDLFFNKVLSDFSRNSYFVMINGTLAGQTSVYLIKNDDLYSFFNKMTGAVQKGYIQKMLIILKKKETLQITCNAVKDYSFINVLPDKTVSDDAKKGMPYFLQKYFKGRVLKDGIADADKYLIISILYQQRITCKIDDESGYVIMDK